MARVGLFLNVEPAAGGIFQNSLSIAHALGELTRDLGDAVALATRPGWRSRLPERPGFRVVEFSIPWRSKALWAAFRRSRLPLAWWRRAAPAIDPTSRAVRDLGCDLWIFPNPATWTFRLPVRAVGFIPDLMHRYEGRFPEVGSPAEFRFREFLFSNLCRHAARIVTDSEVGRGHVIASYGVDPGRVAVLPYTPPPSLAARAAARATPPQPLPPRSYLFYPAQFWKHKNHARLLQAVHRVRAQHPDLRLVLSGSRKNAAADIEALIRELGLGGAVENRGYVDEAEIIRLYEGARALVMPTAFGPTNIPPLEAQALGCPVLVSDIYGSREQLGDSALYFDPESVESIAAAIERVWLDDAQAADLVARGWVRARRHGAAEHREQLGEIIRASLKD